MVVWGGEGVTVPSRASYVNSLHVRTTVQYGLGQLGLSRKLAKCKRNFSFSLAPQTSETQNTKRACSHFSSTVLSTAVITGPGSLNSLMASARCNRLHLETDIGAISCPRPIHLIGRQQLS